MFDIGREMANLTRFVRAFVKVSETERRHEFSCQIHISVFEQIFISGDCLIKVTWTVDSIASAIAKLLIQPCRDDTARLTLHSERYIPYRYILRRIFLNIIYIVRSSAECMISHVKGPETITAVTHTANRVCDDGCNVNFSRTSEWMSDRELICVPGIARFARSGICVFSRYTGVYILLNICRNLIDEIYAWHTSSRLSVIFCIRLYTISEIIEQALWYIVEIQ